MTFHVLSFVYFPLLFLLLLPVGILVCYGIAVNTGHLPSVPIWPYVSDTGVYHPESSIFSFFFTWAAIVSLVIMLAYYKYIEYHELTTHANKAALIVGFISTLGLTFVGSFQSKKVVVPHIIGASTAFGGSVVYSWLLVYISWYYMSKSGYRKAIICFRLILAIIESVCGIILFVALILISLNRNKYYNFATISEWCLIYSAFTFVVTLLYEMNDIRSIETSLVLYSATPEEDSPRSPLTNDNPKSYS